MATKAVRFPFGSISADEDGVTISGWGGPKVLGYDQIAVVSTKFMGKELRIEADSEVYSLKLYNWFRVPAMRKVIEAGMRQSKGG
jgi:hypothetical protein